MTVLIVQASSAAQIEIVRTLFREYQQSLNVDLCFQSFDEELAGLPGKYAPPRGTLLLALDHDLPLGCVALRPIDEHRCEMKRLYVRPSARGRRLGRTLTERIFAHARSTGFTRICLDTLPQMREAQSLYTSLGFEDVAPYVHNPVVGARFMGRTL
jgi:ribosomal protein S18 acetylase RimI-like enzyme